jgi:hypothetical protein
VELIAPKPTKVHEFVIEIESSLSLYCTVASNEQRRKMSAICIPQPALCVVILGKEQRGVSALGRIVVEELVHGSQESIRLF